MRARTGPSAGTLPGTNLSVLKGDLSDQRHTLVLGPGVGQVEVGERAEVDHVGDVLPQRFVDHVVSPDALGLGHGPARNKRAQTSEKKGKAPAHVGSRGTGVAAGGSPEGSQECAVISKDVGNLFVGVVVVRVPGFKVADDIPLTPLSDQEQRNSTLSSDRARLSEGRSGGLLHPRRSSLPPSVAPSRGRPAAGG